MTTTPGPWKYLKNGMIVTRDETRVIGTFHDANGGINRNLVIAAPDTAAALRGLLAIFDRFNHNLLKAAYHVEFTAAHDALDKAEA